MKRPKVSSRVGSNHNERIVEFSNSRGVGGLMSLHETDAHGLDVQLFRIDDGVTIRGLTKPPAIRFIVDTYCSTPDRFGNVSRWARITSTVSGRTLNVHDVGGSQNIPRTVYKALGSQRPRDFDVWSWLHYGEHDIPRKLFQPPEDAIYEGSLTAEAILQLELPS